MSAASSSAGGGRTVYRETAFRQALDANRLAGKALGERVGPPVFLHHRGLTLPRSEIWMPNRFHWHGKAVLLTLS